MASGPFGLRNIASSGVDRAWHWHTLVRERRRKWQPGLVAISHAFQGVSLMLFRRFTHHLSRRCSKVNGTTSSQLKIRPSHPNTKPTPSKLPRMTTRSSQLTPLVGLGPSSMTRRRRALGHWDGWSRRSPACIDSPPLARAKSRRRKGWAEADGSAGLLLFPCLARRNPQKASKTQLLNLKKMETWKTNSTYRS